MVRLAHDQDVPDIAKWMVQTKQETGWRDESAEHNEQSLQLWLLERLHDPLSVCYVWQLNHGLPTAFCGVLLQRLIQPPHMPLVSEWGWAGPKRQAVSCWRACTQWGKKQGAVYGYRVTATSAVHPRRIVETVTWEKL